MNDTTARKICTALLKGGLVGYDDAPLRIVEYNGKHAITFKIDGETIIIREVR